ncbi:ABC superfamily ATP binding cassette transporter, membrane protein [Levilactobacillus hammesii DSM 16381]|uniref:ABC superfamily ATP binding cassette transporter, membrane protein n=1 Tax=Levilactobacillus hammesii DSM 16381 TaxID=1423753 RepID=A0A0R1USU6_9LACO|nr:ABC superfamily ATP binding cassette transporter, membrane protein [Levilactobacillus hammesii DSM 16381]
MRAELFKFSHQKSVAAGILVLIILMTYSVLTTKTNTTQVIFEFGAVQWIPIIMIAIGSTFWAMEYQNRTILILLYKNTSRWQIYLAKLVIVWLYSIVLTLIATLLTIVFKSFLVRTPWSALIINHQTQLDLLMGNVMGTLIYALFIVTLSFMLIMLLKLNAAVIGVGLALGFLGAGISVALMKTFTSLIPILRWNPLNMIFVTQQLANPPYAAVSHLSSLEIIGGNLIYAAIFIFLGYALFKNRRS